jgi:hypothetical protein
MARGDGGNLWTHGRESASCAIFVCMESAGTNASTVDKGQCCVLAVDIGGPVYLGWPNCASMFIGIKILSVRA